MDLNIVKSEKRRPQNDSEDVQTDLGSYISKVFLFFFFIPRGTTFSQIKTEETCWFEYIQRETHVSLSSFIHFLLNVPVIKFHLFFL